MNCKGLFYIGNVQKNTIPSVLRLNKALSRYKLKITQWYEFHVCGLFYDYGISIMECHPQHEQTMAVVCHEYNM